MTDRGRRILFIEPDHDIGSVLRMVLEAEGYQVSVADTEASGLASVRGGNFDLILTDSFYGRSGDAGTDPNGPWSWLDTLRRSTAGVPIIIVTGHAAHLFADYEAHGYAALLTKPFGPRSLLAAIRHHADGTGEQPGADDAG